MRGHAAVLGSAPEARPVLQPSPHADTRGLLAQPARLPLRSVEGGSVTTPATPLVAVERVTMDEVIGLVIGSNQSVEVEVRVNGEARALGRAEEVIHAGR